MGSAAHPRDGHALAPDVLDRPPQIQRHVPRVHPPTAQTWDLRPWRRIRSSVAAKAARGDQQGEHSGRNKSSPWLRNKSSITRATRGAREWATNWLPGDQDRGRQDKGGIPWRPQVASTFAEKCRCAGSRISCGCSKRSTWLGNRQDCEDQPREIRRNPGILGFRQNCGNGLGFFANQPV